MVDAVVMERNGNPRGFGFVPARSRCRCRNAAWEPPVLLQMSAGLSRTSLTAHAEVTFKDKSSLDAVLKDGVTIDGREVRLRTGDRAKFATEKYSGLSWLNVALQF